MIKNNHLSKNNFVINYATLALPLTKLSKGEDGQYPLPFNKKTNSKMKLWI